MDQTALFGISYGVYFIGTKIEDKQNVFVINTLNQLTQSPLQVSITVLKTNYTHDMLQASQQFSASIVSKHASVDLIARFGLQSGRDVDKLMDFSYEVDLLGNPVIVSDCIATLSCKVTQMVDLGSHTLFIAEVVDAKKLRPEQPMTYAFYRDLKMGKVTNERVGEGVVAKDTAKKIDTTYQCSVCHYVYDGETPFDQLPADYVCPICKQPKEVFMAVD